MANEFGYDHIKIKYICLHSHQKRDGTSNRSYIALSWGLGAGQLLWVEITGDLRFVLQGGMQYSVIFD